MATSRSDPRDPQVSRARLRAFAVLAATFVAGAVAGAGIEHVRVGRSREAILMGMPLPPMFEELELSEDQRAKIIAIMERRRPEMDAVMGEVFPRMRALADSMDAEIRALLTPDQQSRFDASRSRRFLHRGPPCPPGASCPPGPPGPRGMGMPPPMHGPFQIHVPPGHTPEMAPVPPPLP